MARKRKRPDDTGSNIEECRKRVKTTPRSPCLDHPTLGLYYVQICTFREHLLSRLPRASRSRRRRIELAQEAVLDTILVCTTNPNRLSFNTSYQKNFITFSQQLSLTSGSGIDEGSTSQSDLVDFAIWLLFHRVHRHAHRPSHILCHGYQRARNPKRDNEDHCAVAGIPGIISHYPNPNVDNLKDTSWIKVLDLLGDGGDRIMLGIILDCAVFAPVEGGRGNYSQLSGTPLTELPMLKHINPSGQTTSEAADSGAGLHRSNRDNAVTSKIAAINFVRSRMFYARPSLNAKGQVTFGLRHIHVLNRYSKVNDETHTFHIMKYIFPRQFGLHNAFTSKVDLQETVQPFKDYTLREQEIVRQERLAIRKHRSTRNLETYQQRLPKRLRGMPFDLVRKLRIRHSRCSYHQLLNYYCSLKGNVDSRRQMKIAKCTPVQMCQLTSGVTTDQSPRPTKPSDLSLVSLATPHSNVSAFCRAVLSCIIPSAFWGCGEQGESNRQTTMQNVDRFIGLRRYENVSLHTISQNIKLSAIPWLIPYHIDINSKAAASDIRKRKEIFEEFLYYVFDSLLIPLVRSTFHVTESNAHQNHLFYFRHDVWRSSTEPAMAHLKTTLFQEIKTMKAKQILDARTLGFSQVRLLPKNTGIRPITNLRRRVTKLQNGKASLGRSINSIMAPVFSVLDYEKRKCPALAGSALFSIGDIYPKLKKFVQRLEGGRTVRKPLYFAKVDAKSCFDTIPQQAVVELIRNIAIEDEYRIGRHAEIKCSENRKHGNAPRGSHAKPARKFISTARASTDFPTFEETIAQNFAQTKDNTIFVDGIVQTTQGRGALLDLLEDHVERNIIKIGKKFYRQKSGIPQGSVLSTLLCNYFYAQLERECLDFLRENDSILLRLIDDFLLITTKRDHAQEFLQIMHDGNERFGIEVDPAKSLANFEVAVNGRQVPRLSKGTHFPYCGSIIDTKTLEITKDRDRRKGTVLAHTLTVEPSKNPGSTFYRKALSTFKTQTHKMFLDTNYNSPNTVMATLYQNFIEVAMKYYRYVKCMGNKRQPHVGLLIGTISDLVDLAFVLIKGKHKVGLAQCYQCAVSKCQVQWLATTAFRSILGRKQSKYREVIAWLDVASEETMPRNEQEAARLHRIAKQGEDVFRGYKY